jgi:hypothetical protein
VQNLSSSSIIDCRASDHHLDVLRNENDDSGPAAEGGKGGHRHRHRHPHSHSSLAQKKRRRRSCFCYVNDDWYAQPNERMTFRILSSGFVPASCLIDCEPPKMLT